MSADVKIVVVNFGAADNESVPLFKTPALAQGGGITILAANVVQGGSTDSELFIVTMGSAGTAVGGTVNTTAMGGTANAFAANTPQTATIANAYVAGNTWIGIKENNVAAANAQAILSINYALGK